MKSRTQLDAAIGRPSIHDFDDTSPRFRGEMYQMGVRRYYAPLPRSTQRWDTRFNNRMGR